MSDIYVIIRNEVDTAMTSVSGIPVVVLAKRQNGLIYDEQPVGLRYADAHFYNLPLDVYTVTAKHPLLNPMEVKQEIILGSRQIVRVKFVYLEPELQLLRIEVQTYNMDN